MRWAALSLAIAIAGTASAAPSARGGAIPRVASPPPGDGLVTRVSPQRAYLNRGRTDGLDVGVEVPILRAGRPVATCRVEFAADHHATCVGSQLAPGDRFLVDTPLAPPPPDVPTARPGQVAPPADVAALVGEELASRGFEPVPFRGAEESSTVSRQASAALTHSSWGFRGLDGYHQERVDVVLRGYELVGGVRLNVAATAFAWSGRPSEARFRPGSPAELFVRELSLSAREPGKAYTAAAGRLWPWHLPGLAILDGAQAGYRNGDFEVGGYGGALPDPVAVSPGVDRWTAGGYWALSHGDAGGWLKYLRHEGRAGILATPEGGLRAETQASVQLAMLGWLDAFAEARAGASNGDVSVDLARADLRMRFGERFRIALDARYFGAYAALVQSAAVGAGPSRRGSVSIDWDPSSDWSFGLVAGLADDLTTNIGRRWVGPEIGLPRAFGDSGHLTFGYLEEFGGQAGRSAYAQAVARLAERVQLLTRVSYFEDALSASITGRDAALFASVDTTLWPWLALRVSALGRTGLNALFAGAPEGTYSVAVSLRANAL